MGTFGGHALPGSFFIAFALWWTVQMFIRYFISLRRNTRFKSTVTYPCSCLCGKLKEWPIESIVKLLFVSLGFTLEIITGMRGWEFKILGNAQHATMFFFFGLSGVMDLFAYFKSPLPKDLDYIIVALALGVEGVLFRFHLHGRSELDIHLHILLIYVVVLNLLTIFAEMRYRHNILAALSRNYFFFLQGTWFWQVGFILYNPNPNAEKWKGDDHDELMIATMFFTWHCGVVFLIMLAIGGVVACVHKRLNRHIEGAVSMEQLIHTKSNGFTAIPMDDDSESDIEFQKPVAK